MEVAPCKDCKDRHIGCHADCDKPEFLHWQEKRETVREKRREAVMEMQDRYYKDDRYRKLRIGNHD